MAMHHHTKETDQGLGRTATRRRNDVLDGKPPRPQTSSPEVFAAAVDAFLSVDGILEHADVFPEQEERLRRLFREAVILGGDDTALIASEFTRLAGLGPFKGLAKLCDRLMEYVNEEQEQLQYDWVRENRIVDPIPEPCRVVVRRWTGVRHVEEHGIALPGGDAPRLGKFRFFDRRRNNLGNCGEIFSTLVLDWEDIQYFEPLTDEDVDLLAASEEARRRRLEGRAARAPTSKGVPA